MFIAVCAVPVAEEEDVDEPERNVGKIYISTDMYIPCFFGQYVNTPFSNTVTYQTPTVSAGPDFLVHSSEKPRIERLTRRFDGGRRAERRRSVSRSCR